MGVIYVTTTPEIREYSQRWVLFGNDLNAHTERFTVFLSARLIFVNPENAGV